MVRPSSASQGTDANRRGVPQKGSARDFVSDALSIRVERRIRLIRGQKVMLDSDLAELYGVETKVFNQAVRRNIYRLPEDSMFQLTPEEYESLRLHFGTSSLRSQLVTSTERRGGGIVPLPLPSKAWRCFRASCGAS